MNNFVCHLKFSKPTKYQRNIGVLTLVDCTIGQHIALNNIKLVSTNDDLFLDLGADHCVGYDRELIWFFDPAFKHFLELYIASHFITYAEERFGGKYWK